LSVGATSCSRHVSASSELCGRIDFANVIKPRYLRPVSLEDLLTPRVILHLQHGLDARELEAIVHAADAAEQADGFHVTATT
jgi:hypothetical protein